MRVKKDQTNVRAKKDIIDVYQLGLAAINLVLFLAFAKRTFVIGEKSHDDESLEWLF